MLLTIDIGNTNITLGVFQEADLLATWRLSTTPQRMADEYGLNVISLLSLAGISLKKLTR